MKRLLIVLFGVLVFQGSVWAAKCDEMTAKVLSPGTGSVLLKRLPFVLQWQDDDLCLGKQVTIGLVSVGEQKTFISYTGDKRDHKRKRENSGYLLIEKLKAPESGDQQYQFIIARGKVALGGESILSEPFSVRRTKQVVDGRSANPYGAGVRDLVIRIAALEATVKALEGRGGTVGGGEETVPGGDGGDIDLSTAEGIKLACNGDNPGSFSIETCKGQPWVAANGVDVATNPVCWDSNLSNGWQEPAVNPWVVGTAAEFNTEAYDCRTKCAGKSGESFDHCAADGWWDKETAKSTVCKFIPTEANIRQCPNCKTQELLNFVPWVFHYRRSFCS